MKCEYIVGYTSAVTGNRITSGYGDKRSAALAAKRLIKEGAKAVALYPFAPCRIA
jgi:hypothetical protein